MVLDSCVSSLITIFVDFFQLFFRKVQDCEIVSNCAFVCGVYELVHRGQYKHQVVVLVSATFTPRSNVMAMDTVQGCKLNASDCTFAPLGREQGYAVVRIFDAPAA